MRIRPPTLEGDEYLHWMLREPQIHKIPNPKLSTLCFIWQGGTTIKKKMVRYAGKLHSVHRLVWMLTQHEYVDVVMHYCEEQRCINPQHLFGATRPEATKIRDERGQTSKGSRHYTTRLTEDQVRQIRYEYEHEIRTVKELAKLYAMSISGIRFITNRKTWKHI